MSLGLAPIEALAMQEVFLEEIYNFNVINVGRRQNTDGGQKMVGRDPGCEA
jgi:hypothetical protein